MPGSAFEYGAHYCSVPREVDPEIAACSFLNSGLRIFDIRDPQHPREVAYYLAPPAVQQGQKAEAAFAQPAFDPARREVYYTDAGSGFWSVKLSDAVWPNPTGASAPKCTSRKSVTIHVRKPPSGRISRVTVTVAGKRVPVRTPRRPLRGDDRARAGHRASQGPRPHQPASDLHRQSRVPRV